MLAPAAAMASHVHRVGRAGIQVVNPSTAARATPSVDSTSHGGSAASGTWVAAIQVAAAENTATRAATRGSARAA